MGFSLPCVAFIEWFSAAMIDKRDLIRPAMSFWQSKAKADCTEPAMASTSTAKLRNIFFRNTVNSPRIKPTQGPDTLSGGVKYLIHYRTAIRKNCGGARASLAQALSARRGFKLEGLDAMSSDAKIQANASACRLYLPAPLRANALVMPDRDQSHYLLNVLRLEDGATLLVFDGVNGEWQARLVRVGKREVHLHIGVKVRPQPDIRALTLAFAPLKHARLDYMVQKATEMGVTRLEPVLTARTQVTRVNEERMRANVMEACEQCGVLQVPEVKAPLALDVWLANRPASEILIFADEAAPITDPMRELADVRTAPGLSLLIGPEGGFSPQERALLLARPGVVRISLGPRILRADTAAVAALALIHAATGM